MKDVKSVKEVKSVKDVKEVKDVKKHGITLVVALVLMAPACGGSATPTGAQTSPAQAGAQVAKGPQQMAQNPTVTPVAFEQLLALMPEPAGWTRNKPHGEQITMGVPVSHADADYEKGESSVKLEITDTSFSQLALAPFSMMLAAGYSERSSDGYRKAVSLGGSPGFEAWENEPKDGEVTVIVGNRFIVSAKGRSVDSIEVVRGFVKGVDLGKLGTLK